MDTSEAGWDLYRTLLAVTREGSFSAAARALRLTQPTVGRHIEALERQLGTALFTRSARRPRPTAAALALVPHAAAMASAAEALQRAASGEAHSERGAVRLTSGELLGVEVLPPMLARFTAHFPRIELELSLASRRLDLLGREADIAVRLGRPTQKALLARRIGSITVGLYAHRRYVDRFGLPERPEELAAFCTIGFDRDPEGVRSAGGRAALLRRDHFRFRCDSAAAQLAAVRAGAGIGGCQVNIARREPELVRVLERDMTFHRELWLVMHKDSRAIRRVRLLYEHLGLELKAYVEG
jgi:DNA-binding transcriptional LysR family regulator